MSDTERFTRRNLPHWYQPGFAHFVTYRQAGTIPPERLRAWRAEREARWRRGPPAGLALPAFREQLHKQFFATYDAYLDAQSGRGDLTSPAVAEMLRENLYHHAGTKYELLAWCIMSNHMHVVLQPLECVPRRSDPSGATDTAGFCDELADGLSPLASVMHSLKSYTANRANALLGRSGRFWQAESYDHWIRDLDELERIVAYVAHNPVRAGLCRRPQEWQYSSAYDRFVRDGSDCALVGWLRETWRGD